MTKIGSILLAAALVVPVAFAQNDAQVQSAVQKALSASRFKDVHASVQNNVTTLTGTVGMYTDKLNAEQKVRHVHGVQAIRDDIQVAGPEIPDQQLQAKLVHAIAYGILGYEPVAFQTISVQVHNGVVLLGGHAAGPIAASDALSAVESTKGVKDVINQMQIDPPSPMDEQIRLQAYRKIYGYPSLQQYAIDPEQPIRIQVLNGHITLYGVVDNQADKEAAGLQANSIPNVFSVTNDLQVANGNKEKPGK